MCHFSKLSISLLLWCLFMLPLDSIDVSSQDVSEQENGQVRLGVSVIIIFLYVQFQIRLAAVSYRGKKVGTTASPVVRSRNKSRDTRNCTQNEPEYEIYVRCTTHLYYKALGIILCVLIWQIRRNYNRLDDGHCDVTGHRKMSALGTAGAMVTTCIP